MTDLAFSAAQAKRLLREPVWVDYTVGGLLPVCGFLVPWGLFESSFGFGRDFFRAACHARDTARQWAGCGRPRVVKLYG